jgi:uncharacterized protein YicC (UPF0701 family)
MDMQVAALDILITKGRFAPEAARAIGEAMDLQIARSHEDLATSQQLKETNVKLESGIAALDAKIERAIAALDAKIEKAMAALDAKIENVRLELKCDMERTKSDVLRWMFAALAAQSALVVGAIRLLMPHGP